MSVELQLQWRAWRCEIERRMAEWTSWSRPPMTAEPNEPLPLHSHFSGTPATSEMWDAASIHFVEPGRLLATLGAPSMESA